MTLSFLMSYAVTFGLLLIRCSGTFGLVPVLGTEVVPIQIRGAIAALIALTLTPVAGPMPMVSPVILVVLAVGEFLFGMTIGLVVRLLILAAEVAGEVVGMQMGFAFGRIVDPLTEESATITATLLGIAATLLFMALDGHRIVVASVGHSLRAVPLGSALSHLTTPSALIPLFSLVFQAGLRIAAPVIAALFLANIGLALLARAAPQLNLFTFSFGISIAVGVFALAYSMWPSLSPLVQRLRDLPNYLSAVMGA